MRDSEQTITGGERWHSESSMKEPPSQKQHRSPGVTCRLLFSAGVFMMRANDQWFHPEKQCEVRFDLMYDDLKGKTKASNVTGGSGGTLDFGAPTARHHLGKKLHQFT